MKDTERRLGWYRLKSSATKLTGAPSLELYITSPVPLTVTRMVPLKLLLLADQPVKVISAVPLKVFRGTKDRSFMDRWP